MAPGDRLAFDADLGAALEAGIAAEARGGRGSFSAAPVAGATATVDAPSSGRARKTAART